MTAQHDSSGLVATLAAQRAAYSHERWPTLAVRRDRLKRLRALTRDYGTDITAAIDADFGGRSVHETRLAELFLVTAAISHAESHLRRWTQPRRVATAARFWPARNRLMPQPLGVVGVVAPWNYPFQLSIGPVVAAIAAGNRVMLKPSELTPHFSELLARLVAELFDPDELHVTTGGEDVGRAFVALPFDHIFFTGSTTVGRQVAMAAATNLTPVTLELGGKSPAIVDPSADMTQAARRIAFGKLLNAGQTCIAPDYLMVPRGRAAKMSSDLGDAVRALYPTISDNPDYSAIISDRHRNRLASLVQDARDKGAAVIEPVPLDATANTRKMAPTLLVGVTASMRVMQEEIFGPILPIIEYDGLDDAIAYVVAGERPLALYWFGTDARSRERVLRETHAGGVTVNDCLWHLAQEDQPFGGIGASGSGSYHGEWGFRTFSHLKPVLHQPAVAGTRFFQPPYGKIFDAMLGALQKLV